MIKPEMIGTLKDQNPLIYNITNTVVSNYVANGLLAIGASPIMSNAKEEAQELANICQALSINIGTLTEPQIQTMLMAGEAANQCNKPVILDPVGVAATHFRQQTIARLINNVSFSAIRGNAGEMAFIANENWQAKGVDSGIGDQSKLKTIAEKIAKQYQTVAIISGEVDYISDGNHTVTLKNGSSIFPMVTGSGCLHGAICAAFMAIEPNNLFSACVTACATYAIAGEMADNESNKNGSFMLSLLNFLSSIDKENINRLSRIEEI